jgi:hypothetical protein
MLSYSQINHHAKLIVHPFRDEITKEISEKFPSVQVNLINQKVIDIETIKNLLLWHTKETGNKKVAVISFHRINHEAQNAMLKLIEEPRADTSFIFITTQKENILPTVLSRMIEVNYDFDESAKGGPIRDWDDEAYKFLQTQKVSRMKLPIVTELLETEDSEGRKDRELVQNFCMKLEYILANFKKGQFVTELLEIRKMISYLGDVSGSPKMILEYLSFLLPQMS